MENVKFESLNNDTIGLAWGFQVNPSSCGNHEHYENYIRFIARQDQLDGLGNTHILTAELKGQRKLLGYITLRASAYTKKYADRTLGEPALEIAELAVSQEFEGQGFGSILVKLAFAMAVQLNEEFIGVRHIVLCADNQAVGFYEKFGFDRLEDQGEVPRENWNIDCVPMFICLPELPS